jgi:tetratricopeptide (TPR) repeat protein
MALFSLLVCAVFFAGLELLLAAIGVDPVLDSRDPYVGFSRRIPLFVEQRAPDGRTFLVTAENRRRHFNIQSFSREKAPDTFRIFCVGGSTTYGRPYRDGTSFCGWLRELLPAADPSRRFEVVNAGGISYASYRVAALMEELSGYEPDLFIVYSGQNEFLERRTYGALLEMPEALRNLAATLSATRTYSALQRGLAALRGVAGARAPSRAVLPGEVETLLDDAMGPAAYTRDDSLAAQVVEHYRFNLGRIVETANSAGAAAILVTPASNLRDFSPFKSEHRSGLGASDRARWRDLVSNARTARADERLADSLRALDEALAIDLRHAEAHFLRGHALLSLGRSSDARVAFERARDEDVCPLRALTPMLGAVTDVARERSVPRVDFPALLDARAADGIPGDDLFLDHVHPTLEGYRLLALALLDEMVAMDLLQPAPTWGPAAIDRVTSRVKARIDAHAHGAALRNLSRVLGWAGKFEEADRLALRAESLAPGDPWVHVQIANARLRRGDLADAARHFERALSLQPGLADAHVGLGNLYLKQDRRDQAAHHYRRALALDPATHRAHNGLGVVFAGRGDLVLAVGHFEAAVRLRPGFADAHNNLGRVFYEQGDRKAAMGHFERALAFDPGIEPARTLLRRLRGGVPE